MANTKKTSSTKSKSKTKKKPTTHHFGYTKGDGGDFGICGKKTLNFSDRTKKNPTCEKCYTELHPKSKKAQKKRISKEDTIFVTAYVANMIGRDRPKFPTLTASEVAMELAKEFLNTVWGGEQEEQVEELDDYLCTAQVEKRIADVAKLY